MPLGNLMLTPRHAGRAASETLQNGPSGIRIRLELPDTKSEAISGRLVGIHHGQLHLTTESWAQPGAKALLRFGRIAVIGRIDYCRARDGMFRTSFAMEDTRSAPRFPIDERGVLTILDGEADSSHECTLSDISLSGVAIDSPVRISPGCMICVQTDRILVVGEVRHSHPKPGAGFRLGVAVTDVVRSSIPAPAKRFRRYLAELIFGEPISKA